MEDQKREQDKMVNSCTKNNAITPYDVE